MSKSPRFFMLADSKYAQAGVDPRYPALCAWHELRDLPGPGTVRALFRGFGNPPRGCRSLIDESKILDPVLAGAIDHFIAV